MARSLSEVDRTLHRLGLYLLFIGLGGIAIASGLGLLVGQETLRPIGQLTELAEEVTETRDLSRRIGGGARDDELGRLASAFDEMLAALDTSLKAQRQLVADASHELRTPLASLRTNVEVLAGGKRLPAEERKKLLADVPRPGGGAERPRRRPRRARSGRAAGARRRPPRRARRQRRSRGRGSTRRT